MPIAGNNVEAIPMQIVGNKLIEHARTRIPSHMAQSPQAAILALRRGEIVYVRLFGLNVANVRSACGLEGLEVGE